MKKAIQDGDAVTIKQVWNYVDGLPKQEIDSTLKGEIIVKLTKYGDNSSS